MQVFIYNRVKDYESKTYSVIAHFQDQALAMIVENSNTSANEWHLVGQRDNDKPGIVGFISDDLGV